MSGDADYVPEDAEDAPSLPPPPPGAAAVPSLKAAPAGAPPSEVLEGPTLKAAPPGAPPSDNFAELPPVGILTWVTSRDLVT